MAETAVNIDALRAQVREIMAAEGLSQVAAARQIGISDSTLSEWLSGKYRGADKSVEVARWIETRRAQAEARIVMPTPPAFVETQTARDMLDIMTFAHAMSDFAVVVGAAGIGKTSTILEYQRANSRVYVLGADKTCVSPNAMLMKLAKAMGVTEKRSVWLSEGIIDKVRNANALIVIDEAQHLSTDALDQLRSIPDATECGIVVAGNESLLGRLTGKSGSDAALYAQLFSRVGARLVRSQVSVRDINMILDAWPIEDPEVRGLLGKIGKKPGALRILTKTIRLAAMYAAGEGAAVSAVHIRRAWGQLSSAPIDDAA